MNIDQEESVRLITSYWTAYKSRESDPSIRFSLPVIMGVRARKSKPTQTTNSRLLFIGDVHGDLNQFLLPLVDNGIIELTGRVQTAYKGKTIERISNVYVPEFKILRTDIDVYYLGDFIDEGNYSRNIVLMLDELTKKLERLHLVIGNHEANLLSYYNRWKEKTLRFADVKSYWSTLQKELSAYEEVQLVKDQLIIRKKGVKSEDFLYDYTTPLFKTLHKLFISSKIKIAYECKLGSSTFIVSHTLITNRAINDLIAGIPRRKGDDTRPIVGGDPKSIGIDQINDMFLHSTSEFIGANRLVYNRLEKDLRFDNYIVGHTPGGSLRQLHINEKLCKFDDERAQHCTPTKPDARHSIYYFDILASAGLDHDNVSTPDYFYWENDMMKVSHANALHLEYASDKNELVFEEYNGKSKTDGVRRLRY